ncbi:trypsin-like serine protease [Aeromonas sobria]|nr:trypsin-like serine protease [Aeromonas sobria]
MKLINCFFSMLLLLLVSASQAHAILINEEVFEDNGGDLSDIAMSIRYANDDLRERSYINPFFTVGRISGCTATWLGTDDDDWVYILTAAHCFNYQGQVTSLNSTFTAWDGKVIAKGNGYGYVPSQRINKPSGMKGGSTDIGILKLPLNDILVDDDGNPVRKPVIYDGRGELNKKVIFVGYGAWGVGLDTKGSYGPASGPRRLYGESTIDSFYELDHGISASYKPTGITSQWARVASGDSGSAWWQRINGVNVIVATTNGGSEKKSTGARVSKYAGWIQSIYSDVNLFSD